MDMKRDCLATHVTVKHPTLGYLWHGTMAIVLDCGERVWISGGYSMEQPDDVIQVTDNTCDGFDSHGCCVFSIPAAWCKFHTMEEETS